MCGRYALTRTELLEEFFEFSFTGNQILPRFNVAPTTQIPVIRPARRWATRVDRSAMGVGSFLVQARRSTAALDQCESRNAFKQARVPRCVSTSALHRSRQWILRVAETSRWCKAALLHHASRWAPHRVCWSLGECKGVARNRCHRDDSGK